MRILSSRFILISITALLISGVLLTSFYSFVVRASVSNLYAATCLGGWENTHLAAGAPEALESGGAPVFTEGNSARLTGDAHAQIYCGGFSGDILENTVPKKILVKFSWAVEYSKLIAEPIQASEETAATTTTETLKEEHLEVINTEDAVDNESSPSTEESVTEPETTQSQELPLTPDIPEAIELEQTPQETPPIEESAATSTEALAETAATTTLDTATTTLDIATTTGATSYGLVEVLYTLDGVEWKSLGFVEKDEFGSKHFEIPIEEASEWEDISKIQIGIQSVPVIDSIAPIIYLDSVWLEVEYQNSWEDPFVPPGEKDGDTILSEAQFENKVAVLVSRKNPLVFGDPTLELWLASITTIMEETDDVVSTTTPTIYPRQRLKNWQYIVGDDFLSRDPRVAFIDGNVFWFGRENTAVWQFNPLTSAYNSISINFGEPLELYFQDMASEWQILQTDPQGKLISNDSTIHDTEDTAQ